MFDPAAALAEFHQLRPDHTGRVEDCQKCADTERRQARARRRGNRTIRRNTDRLKRLAR